MNNRTVIIVFFAVIISFIVIWLMEANYHSGTSQKSSTLSNTQQVQTHVNPPVQTSVVPTVASHDPQDVVPGLYPDPIHNTATTEGFKITSLMVENNTDANGNPVSDHLQFLLQNLTSKPITNLEVYYTISDATTHKKEGYYKKLTNYVLQPNATQTINFDNKPGMGHFTVNIHSLYFTTIDALQFTVMVSAPGYKLETANVTKAAGGAETKD